MTPTLDGLDTAQLRDLLGRTKATLAAREEQERVAKEKAAKDIIPPPGTFWKYNKRVWTVVDVAPDMLRRRALLSADKDGGDLRYWLFFPNETKLFSKIATTVHAPEILKRGGHEIRDVQAEATYANDSALQGAVGRLVLTARTIH